jgi:alkanesulfonate monooxygenase SsuD/methylene tetrahydromethanopterin reductase-like flavin-dependent oxidoreductase (luciferase family)
MKFGLDVPISGAYADPHLLAGLAADAEAAGWDGLFLQDGLAGPEPTVDPWVSLAAVALRTQRIRIGVFLTPLPRRRPWEVARQAVTVDHLSRGRLIFGAALGHSDRDFVPFGEEWDIRIRAQKLDESLEILAGLWSGRPFSYAGSHYRLDEVTFVPGPVQQPRIPVWVAAGWPRRTPLRRAARWDGVYLMTVHQDTERLLTPDDVGEVARVVGAERSRTEPLEIGVNAVATGDAAADRAAVDAFGHAGATWWIELAAPDGRPETYRRRISEGPPS